MITQSRPPIGAAVIGTLDTLRPKTDISQLFSSNDVPRRKIGTIERNTNESGANVLLHAIMAKAIAI